MRLILAEDDSLLGGALRTALTRAGFAVDWVLKGRDFSDSMMTQRYDLVVLDLTLPDASGEELLRSLRTKHPRLPVIVVTARGGVRDRVNLLDMGADDYLVKPFDLDEMIARTRSVLRRSPSDDEEADTYTHGLLRLNPQRHTATWNDEPIALTRREFCVLQILVRRRNQVSTRAQLEEALYGWGEEVESNAVEVYVHFLRRKFSPGLIHTVRGVGYQLAPALLQRA
jgi:DNA-binding response OmpR family regulator